MNHRPSSSRRPVGFTLVEILVVVAIIALLLAIAVTALSMANKSNDMSVTRNTVHALEDSVNSFMNERSQLPPIAHPGSSIQSDLEDNAHAYVNMLTATKAGRDTIATLKTSGAIVVNPDNSLSPVDAWGQNILMSGDATPTDLGTVRWFWSVGPKKGVTNNTNDSGGGNPVQGDDIGGTVNTRK